MVVKRIVLKVDVSCNKCKKKIMHAVSRLEGVDKIEIDTARSTLTVIGTADPIEMIIRVRKAGKFAQVLSIGPLTLPPPPPPQLQPPRPPLPLLQLPLNPQLQPMRPPPPQQSQPPRPPQTEMPETQRRAEERKAAEVYDMKRPDPPSAFIHVPSMCPVCQKMGTGDPFVSSCSIM